MTDRRAHPRPTPDRRQLHEERDLRAHWASHRRVGDHVAVFHAGQTVRCPGSKQLPPIASHYAEGAVIVCAKSEGWTVRPGSVVTVLAGPARHTARPGGQERTCTNCGMRLVVLEDALDGRAA